jgi:hypothetical protein
MIEKERRINLIISWSSLWDFLIISHSTIGTDGEDFKVKFKKGQTQVCWQSQSSPAVRPFRYPETKF